MVCGERLEYGARPEPLRCYFCGETKPGTISCKNGHFVCDECHGKDALAAITYFALHTTSCDPIEIAEQMMSHPSVPMIGGEHHAIVATSVMAALKISAPVTYNDQLIIINNDMIERALDRTWTDRLPSCMCAYNGICGAAIGAGTVISLLTDATCDVPKKKERQAAMKATNDAANHIAEFQGTCCKLSTRLAIESASRAVKELLGVDLPLSNIVCAHKKRNPYKCFGPKCPYSGDPTS